MCSSGIPNKLIRVEKNPLPSTTHSLFSVVDFRGGLQNMASTSSVSSKTHAHVCDEPLYDATLLSS